ncbi:hypothetical protein [Pseudomonas aeruginosa]|uniref:hypothetical protein n=1 Tax=Pseudomonas aeruginosa TaxID=287 RepID=UPI001EE75FD2|nr:hypothetical protein [Pseudomonas aeruginosa]
MTNLQIAALVQPSMVTQLLTADGGEWEVSKHLQEIMALAADGTLYLSESHQNDIHVLSFIDRLDRRGFRYQLNLTDLQTIHQLYRAVAMDGLVDSDGQRATQMQERVVKIIRKATELRASDVHFVVSPAGTGSKIRFRVDGLLKTPSSSTAARNCTNFAQPSTSPCATWPSRFSSRNWTRTRG